MTVESEHYVYLLAQREGDRLTAPVKIGITGNVGARYRTIQTSCPFPIALVHCLNFPMRAMARSVEAGFHKAQNSSQAHGEWFDMEPVKALSILCLMVRVAVHVNGFEGDEADVALEAFGAGTAAHAIIEQLATTSLGGVQ